MLVTSYVDCYFNGKPPYCRGWTPLSMLVSHAFMNDPPVDDPVTPAKRRASRLIPYSDTWPADGVFRRVSFPRWQKALGIPTLQPLVFAIRVARTLHLSVNCCEIVRGSVCEAVCSDLHGYWNCDIVLLTSPTEIRTD